MPKFKIIYDRDICIGSFACQATAPDFWIYNEDGKADLKNAIYNAETKKWELVIEEEQDFDDNQAAAESCPVFAIKVEKIDDKPVLHPDHGGHHDVGDWKGKID